MTATAPKTPPQGRAHPIVIPTTTRLRPHVRTMWVMVVALTLPLYLTGRTWGLDWGVHAWLTWVQGASISGGGPSLFLHNQFLGAFYPQYEFYGATLYTISGGLSAALGGKALVAHSVLWVSAFVAAYVGMLWLSLQAGLRSWQAHASPIILLTSAYWLTNAYARGAFAELVGTSGIPLLIAATISLLRADRLRAAPVFALMWGMLMLTGAHNITLMWGSIWLAAIAVVVLWALPRHGRELPPRRTATVLALLVLAVAINGWYLLPDLLYSGRTGMAAIGTQSPFIWEFTDVYVTPELLFSPFHAKAPESTTPGLFTNLPVLALLWAVVNAVAVRRIADQSERRALAGLTVVLLLLVWLLMTHWPWEHLLPRRLHFIQYTFRLETYIAMTISFMTILVLRALPRRAAPRRAVPVLGVVLVCSLVSGVWQTWSTGESFEGLTRQAWFDRGPTQVPPSWNDGFSFRDGSDPRIHIVRDDRWFAVNIDEIEHDRFDGLVTPPDGPEPLGSNLRAGEYQLDIGGQLKVIGRSNDGKLVFQRAPDALTGPVRMTIKPKDAWPVAVGRVLTFVALGLTVLLFLVLGARELWAAASRALFDAPPAQADGTPWGRMAPPTR